MIEDGLRDIIAGTVTVPVYSRLLPLALPDCVCVQYSGGDPVDAGIRRTRHRVTVMACASDRLDAVSLLRTARNALITSMPQDVDGVHYYTAVGLGDGSLKRKALNGPRYIEYTDLEVTASL